MKALIKGRRSLAAVLAVVMLATVLMASWPTMLTKAADTGLLQNKSAVFFGDSIAAGIAEEMSAYGMTVTNKAADGARFGDGSILGQITAAGAGSYDYVILQGGVHDAALEADTGLVKNAGTISNNFFPEYFDTTTFGGGLEMALYWIRKQYPNAKVGFVITYQMPASTLGGVTKKASEMRKYWSLAKQIGEKWDVQVLDLFDGVALSATDSSAIKPHVAEWMAGITAAPETRFWSAGYESYSNRTNLTAAGTPDAATGTVLNGIQSLYNSKNYAAVSNERAHSGSMSLKFHSPEYPNAMGRAQYVLTDDNGNKMEMADRKKDYLLTFWVYVPSAATGNLRYWLSLDNGDSSFEQTEKEQFKLFEVNSQIIEKDTWVQISHEFNGMSAQNLPTGANYLRLGVTTDSTPDNTNRNIYIDDIQLSMFGIESTMADYEQYAAGTAVVGGNGSGKEVSSTHAHGGNGADVPGQKAVRLMMNQVADGNHARTVVQTAEGNHFQAAVGSKYRISFWAYWAADEGNCGYTDELLLSLKGGTCGDPMAPYKGAYDTGNEKKVTVKANTWTKLSFVVVPQDCPNFTMNYLTLGARFDGASTERIGYLYVDDVEVNLLSAGISKTSAIEAPNGALLYNDGTNATYYNAAKGQECTAMRVMGLYPTQVGQANMVNVEGLMLPIVSRGILLGDNNATDAALRVTGTYLHKVETTGDALNSYWDYQDGKIVYTLLLKNITAEKKGVAYSYRTFLKVKLDDEILTLYSPVVNYLSAQNIYNGTGAPYKWFGNISGESGSVGDSVSLLDSVNSRYSIVYDADDAQAKAAAEELQKQMVRLLGNTKIVTCASDTEATTVLPYEILIGSTNRGEDDGVISAVAGSNSQHDAAFAVQYNNKKVAIAAKNTGDTAKYGIVLNYAVDYFLEQISDSKAVSTSMSFNSTQKSLAAGTGGNPGRVYTVNGLDLMHSVQIVVEKYPSYMVMEAARDLQRYLATNTGEYAPIMKGVGNDSDTYSRVFLGPQQGAVRVHYAESAWGNPVGPVDPDRTGDTGNDDGAFDLTPTGKEGYVDTNQTDSALLKTGNYGDYEIKTAGRKVTVNGSSVYAVNAGVQKLIAMLETAASVTGVTGNYEADGQYSLSGGYGMAYEENFDYTNATDLKAKYTVDVDKAAGPTKVDRNEVGEGNYITSNGIDYDVQSRPAIWGTDGTYYAEDGYLYEYTRKSDNGYTAVRVTTQNRMTYRYGFTEVRMVTGTDNGACSAIWAVSEGRPGSEIDVYENFGQDKLVVNMHCWDGDSYSLDAVDIYKGATKTYASADRLESGEHFYDTFHYVGFEWDEYEFTYYMDGEAWLTVDITKPMYKGSVVWIDEVGLEVFRQPIWIKLTNGVGNAGYTSGHNPKDYARDDGTGAQGQYYTERTDGKYNLNTVEDFCETQVVDYMYIFQKQGNGSHMNLKY